MAWMWADYDHVGAPLNPLRWSEKLTTRGALKSLGAFLEREAERHRPVLLGFCKAELGSPSLKRTKKKRATSLVPAADQRALAAHQRLRSKWRPRSLGRGVGP